MGLSAYDKQRYKESKRRRRQALMQSETGYIKPYRRGKNPLILILCVIAALGVAAAGVFAVMNIYRSARKQPAPVSTALDDRQLLRVVNRMHPLQEDEVPPLESFQGVNIHAGIVGDLERLTEAAAEKGIELRVTEGYVSFKEQKKRYEDNLAVYMQNPAYTPVRAEAAALKTVPEAGCSEAQTGLLVAFDLSDARVKPFLEMECINYGFILRYPEGKEDLTHLDAGESLYRYVGAENAAKMRSFAMCLEEYADYTDLQSEAYGNTIQQ